MALPNPQDFIFFLKQYLIIRDRTWSSTLGKVFSNAIERQKTCDELELEFKNAKTIEDWIKLIKLLGKIARQIQKEEDEKYLQNPFNYIPGQKKDSLLCQTLHAIRNFANTTIKGSLDSDLAHYTSHIEELIKKINSLETEIDRKEGLGIDISQLEKDRNDLILELADLDHDKGIRDAEKYKLFVTLDTEKYKIYGVLQRPQSTDRQNPIYGKNININRPFCYQTLWFAIFYVREIKPYMNKALSAALKEFGQKSLSPAQDDLSDELIEKNEDEESDMLDGIHSVETSFGQQPSSESRPPTTEEKPNLQIVTTEESKQNVNDNSVKQPDKAPNNINQDAVPSNSGIFSSSVPADNLSKKDEKQDEKKKKKKNFFGVSGN